MNPRFSLQFQKKMSDYSNRCMVVANSPKQLAELHLRKYNFRKNYLISRNSK